MQQKEFFGNNSLYRFRAYRQFVSLYFIALFSVLAVTGCNDSNTSPTDTNNNGANGSVTWIAANAGIKETSVQALAVDGSSLLAGTSQGLYRSSDNGGSWTVLNTDFNIDVQSLVVSDSVYLAARSFLYGVYRSTNKGVSWTSVLSGTNAWALAVSGSNIFVGTSRKIGTGPVFVSTNKGATWSEANNGLPSTTTVWALAVSGTTLLASTTSEGVFRSTNNGANWVSSNTGLPTSRVRSFCVTDSIILAGIDGSGVFKSTDEGVTWVKVENGLTVNSGISFGVAGGSIYVGSYSDYIFRSSDKGESWHNTGRIEVDPANYDFATPNCFVTLGTNLFAGTTNAGVFRSVVNN